MGAQIVYGQDYRAKIADSNNRLRGPDSNPYLFLNRQQLRCTSPVYCDAVGLQTGVKALPKPGNLIDIACSLLASPLPAACHNSGPAQTGPKYNKECENCAEVGSWQWQANSSEPRPGRIGVAVLGAVLCAGFLASLVACQRWRRSYSLAVDAAEYRPSLTSELAT